jgi:hypothetical protein
MNDSSELLGYAKSGNRMYFDGVNDLVRLTGMTSSNNYFGSCTIEATIYARDTGGTRVVCSLGSASYRIFSMSGTWHLNTSTNTGVAVTSGLQTIAVNFDSSGNATELKINGTTEWTGSASGAAPSTNFEIGSRANGLHWNGLIYDFSLSGSSVKNFLLNGYGNTDSDWEDQVGSNDGTVIGSPALFTGQGFHAYVTTWYDQSGNFRDATQTTASAQPTIVDNGSVITDSNGYATIEFDGSGDYFQLPFAAGSNSSYFITSLVEPNDNTTNQFLVDFRDGAGDGITLLGLSSGVINARTNAVSASQNYDSDPQLFTGEYTGTDLTAYVDSVGGTSLSGSDTNATTNGRIGSVAYGGGTLTWSGTISEMIIYLSDESANRSAIELNIIDRYGP